VVPKLKASAACLRSCSNLSHFSGGFVGKGDRHDVVRTTAAEFNQISDPMGNHSRLAAAPGPAKISTGPHDGSPGDCGRGIIHYRDCCLFSAFFQLPAWLFSSARNWAISSRLNLRSPRGLMRYAFILPLLLQRLRVLGWIWKSRATSLTVSMLLIWSPFPISFPVSSLINLS